MPNQIEHIKASEFKARCLQLMDEVNATNKEIIITKNGKPVSRLVPYTKKVDSLFGLHKGILNVTGDVISPIDVQWDAEK